MDSKCSSCSLFLEPVTDPLIVATRTGLARSSFNELGRVLGKTKKTIIALARALGYTTLLFWGNGGNSTAEGGYTSLFKPTEGALPSSPRRCFQPSIGVKPKLEYAWASAV